MVHTIFMVILAVMGPVRATRREKHKNHRVEVNENLYADPCSAGAYVSGALSLLGHSVITQTL